MKKAFSVLFAAENLSPDETEGLNECAIFHNPSALPPLLMLVLLFSDQTQQASDQIQLLTFACLVIDFALSSMCILLLILLLIIPHLHHFFSIFLMLSSLAQLRNSMMFFLGSSCLAFSLALRLLERNLKFVQYFVCCLSMN